MFIEELKYVCVCGCLTAIHSVDYESYSTQRRGLVVFIEELKYVCV